MWFLCRLLDLLKAEGSLISGLKKLELKGKVLQKVMKLNIKANSNDKHLLDIRDSSIVVGLTKSKKNFL